MEVISDYLDILEQPKFDNSIESYQYALHQPESQSNLNVAGLPITIEIQAADRYLIPARSHLYIEGNLRRADNNQSYAANDEVALVNNAMMYLFSNIEYGIDGKTMESLMSPGQTTSILGYLSYPDDFNTSAGLKLCWSKDTTDNANSAEFATSAAAPAAGYTPARNPNYNQGFTARKTLLMSANPRGNFSFIIPFSHMFGFAEYDKVLYNIKQYLILTRNTTDNLAIHRNNNAVDGKIVLTKMLWRVPEVKLQPSILATMRSYVTEKKSFSIHFSGRTGVYTAIPQNCLSYEWHLPVKSRIEKPRWIIVGFQTSKNLTQEQNSSVFDHLNLQKAYVELNSQVYPAREVVSNFATNQYSVLYEMLDDFKKEYYGYNSLIGGTQVNLATFKTLFPLFVFDVRKQEDKVSSGVVDMRLQFNFYDAVPANTNAYAVVISDRLFKLTSDGKNLTMSSY